MPPDPNPPLNWKQFTLDRCLQQEPAVNKRAQLISKALKSASWKSAGGIIFLGAIGWNEELYLAGEHVASVIDRYVDAFDLFTGSDKPSILDSDRIETAPRIQTPPNIHQRVRLHDGWPDLSGEDRTLVFCAIAEGEMAPLLTLRPELLRGAVLVGFHKDLQDLAKKKKLKYRYVSRAWHMICVRVV